MEATTQSLIDAIEQERTERNLSDRQFSIQVLGISPAYWCRLKSGDRLPTLNVLRLLMQKLPQLAPEVTTFIISQGNDHTSQKVKEKDAQNKVGGTLGAQERA